MVLLSTDGAAADGVFKDVLQTVHGLAHLTSKSSTGDAAAVALTSIRWRLSARRCCGAGRGINSKLRPAHNTLSFALAARAELTAYPAMAGRPRCWAGYVAARCPSVVRSGAEDRRGAGDGLAALALAGSTRPEKTQSHGGVLCEWKQAQCVRSATLAASGRSCPTQSNCH